LILRSDLLHVVTAVANPLRWQSRMHLFGDFEQHMLESGVQLTVVECAYGERPHEVTPKVGVRHVPVRAHTVMWTKENLLNLGIASLPQDWRYVAWIDADIYFRRPDWAAETVQALQLHDVVQPWTDCYDLGPDGEHMEVHRSFGSIWQSGGAVGKGYGKFAHPGYAWAATRQALDWLGGLIETAALGAADHHMALALVGKVERSLPGGISEAYRRPLLRWQARATRHIAGNIAALPGTIEHAWHGAKSHRRYIERWDVLNRHRFDPDEDLKRNVWGVLELAGNKPALRRDMDAYFCARREDANVMDNA
jgi:hypothetical protein